MDANLKKPNWPLGVVGAVAGGVAGYFVFLWAGQQGFYAIVVPGAAVGLGCAALAKGESRGLGILCALLAVAAGLFSEWKISLDDDGNPASLGYFLAHLNELQAADAHPDRAGRGLRLLAWQGAAETTRPTREDRRRWPTRGPVTGWINR